MITTVRSTQILPNVWVIDDFLVEPASIRESYRSNATAWSAMYNNRLLTTGNHPTLVELHHQCLTQLRSLMCYNAEIQQSYASLDLSSGIFAMHRLHEGIGAYLQIFMGHAVDPTQRTVICHDHQFTESISQDYCDISAFPESTLTYIDFVPNRALLIRNDPRMFVGAIQSVSPNAVREAINLQFR